MTFQEYEAFTDERMFFNPDEDQLIYAALGLGGESGEVVDQVKKYWRDDKSQMTPERKTKLLLEMGDVLFYLTRLGKVLGVGLDKVADLNKEKLEARHNRGGIVG